MTEPPAYRTRTTVLFASKAPRAVVLRRGPRTHHRLILWNTDLDTFEPGQWMKGNVRLCDLSPSGRLLLYFAEQYHRHSPVRISRGPYDPLKSPLGVKPKSLVRRGRKLPHYIARAFEFPPPRAERGSWTAISKPPYFSALAIWPSLGRWTGGGRFKSEREIVVQESAGGMTPIANTPIPQSVRIISGGQAAMGGPAAYQPTTEKSERQADIAAALNEAGLLWIDWISLRHEPDLLFAGDGRIFRLQNCAGVPITQYLERARPLIDLRDVAFELVAAPDEAVGW
jgi:hypothetical protein